MCLFLLERVSLLVVPNTYTVYLQYRQLMPQDRHDSCARDTISSGLFDKVNVKMAAEHLLNGKRDILNIEKKAVLTYMRQNIHITWPNMDIRRVKNVFDSARYRQKGNELYKSNFHDEKVHEKIWKLYSQSIALSPNNSEELALGYGNRSALLFHLKLCEESIKDCDRAVHLTSSIILKVKYLCRKAECLALLREPTAKDVASEAFKLINQNPSKFVSASDMKSKLSQIIVSAPATKSESSNNENYYDEFTNFPRQSEAPCASKSVSIKYDKQWGRHIVAEKDINVGEIISIEDNCYTFISHHGMYLFCSNCARYTWSSIPCEHCIYDVYCSESCRTEAWIKYHQFECALYPLFWNFQYIDEDINIDQFSLRLLFIAVHQAGNIDEMRKQIEDIENCKDPRIKGFTNGIFESNKAKSYYSLLSTEGRIEYRIKSLLIEHTCTVTYFLAILTNFFGRRLNILDKEMFLNEDILFVAALLLHTHYLTTYNACLIADGKIFPNSIKKVYAKTIHPFTSLFNHSCDPNVGTLMTRNNKTVLYALQPISKGSQLFRNYGPLFYRTSRIRRYLHLRAVYHFTCTCLPCKEKWSHICLPSLDEIVEITPALRQIFTMHHHFFTILNSNNFKKLVEDYLNFLRLIARKITVHCSEYLSTLETLLFLLEIVFDKYLFQIPSECS